MTTDPDDSLSIQELAILVSLDFEPDDDPDLED